MTPDPSPAGAVRNRLLAWYDTVKRPLPWRETRDPYAIWVSEIMLQQTRVETVIPYYRRFLTRFPDVQSLADAPEDAVMSAWSGLGYYRRARLLQSGARELVSRHAGTMPRDADARRALPGIGRYTAGAIGSIAFDLEEPLVDGNVARVLARLDAIDLDPTTPAAQRAFWARASELVRGERPGDLNQALMELGATTCIPKSPRCLVCPLSELCLARRTGRTDELPPARPKKEPKLVEEVALRAQRDGRIVLVQRREPGLFGGLWQLPRADGHGREPAIRALSSIGGDPDESSLVGLGSVERLLTHRRIRIEIWQSDIPPTLPDGAVAMTPEERESVGISSFTRAILAHEPSPQSEPLTKR